MDKIFGPPQQYIHTEEGKSPLLSSDIRYTCNCALDLCLFHSCNEGCNCNCMNCCCRDCKCQVSTCRCYDGIWCKEPDQGLCCSILNIICGYDSSNYCGLDIIFPGIPCLHCKCTG
jgi:hypothetical protein